MTDTSLNELMLFRRAHLGAARLGAQTNELLTKLKACRLRLVRSAAIQQVASNIYFNSSYDACERYETVEEFIEELTPDMDAVFKEQELIDGVTYYVLRPFFTDTGEFLHALNVGYLRGCKPSELEELNREVPTESSISPTGLTTEEIQALVDYHKSSTLKILNAIRHLSTALYNVERSVARLGTPVRSYLADMRPALDSNTDTLLVQLRTITTLPFLPAPAQFFGTEADRTNPLKTLPADDMVLEPLLRHA